MLSASLIEYVFSANVAFTSIAVLASGTVNVTCPPALSIGMRIVVGYKLYTKQSFSTA